MQQNGIATRQHYSPTPPAARDVQVHRRRKTNFHEPGEDASDGGSCNNKTRKSNTNQGEEKKREALGSARKRQSETLKAY